MEKVLKIRSALVTIALGLAGGGLFKLLGFPMPWLIGSMMMLAFIAVSNKIEVNTPKPIRKFMLGMLGVMVSSTLDTSILADAHKWWASLVALPLILITQFLVVQLILKYMAPQENFATRFFGGAAGGLLEMVAMAKENNGDERSVLVMHMLRLSLLVFFSPFLFNVTLEKTSKVHTLTEGLFSYDLESMILTFLCLFGGMAIGRLIRLPAYMIVGPFLASAICYSTGIIEAKPPYVMMVLAQIVVGADLGTRFAGYSVKRISKLLLPTAVLTFALTVVSAFFAYSVHFLIGLPFSTLFLAFMPGGMTQMSLIALTLNLNVSFVALHLIVRVLFVVFLAPTCYKIMLKVAEKGQESLEKEKSNA